MPTKCCWVIHGSLTSERKASTSPSSFINRPCCSIERSSAKLLVFTCTSKFERSTGSERVDALGQRAVEVIICMITRDFSVISMTSQASLSLSLPLTKVTDAQYRKRFRASYNIVWLALGNVAGHLLSVEKSPLVANILQRPPVQFARMFVQLLLDLGEIGCGSFLEARHQVGF